jgi:hypothetical protein
MDTISILILLERKMQIFEDIKKQAHYRKDTGKWFWSDRDDDNLYGPFDTFFDAVNDAIEPYENQ